MSLPRSLPSSLRGALTVDRFVPIAVAVVAFVLARAAMLPGVWFWDTAEAQTVGPLLGVMHPTGFPAYVVLGWLASIVFAPFGEPAFRMNLLSAVLVAASVATAVVVARRLGVPLLVAAAAGLGLATTPIVWKIGTHADAHSLHLAVIALVSLLLIDWELRMRGARESGEVVERAADRRLVAAAALFGVALANHQLSLLLIPAFGLGVLLVDRHLLRRRSFVATAMGACVLVALVIYLELPLRAGPFRAPLVYGHPETLDGFLYVVLAEQFRGSFMNPLIDVVGTLLKLLILWWDQLGPLLVLLPFGFLATWRLVPGYALASGLGTLITVLFATVYDNADIRRYYLVPVFFAWSWLAALGGWGVRRAFASWEPDPPDETPTAGEPLALPAPWRTAFAAALVPVLIAAILLIPVSTGYRERWRYADRSTDRSGQQWLDAAFAALPQDAVVVSWWSYSTTLWYGQLIDGLRPDLLIIDDRTRLDEGLGEVTDVIDAHLGRRPVYLIQTDEDLLALHARYVLDPVGDKTELWQVVERQDAP
jgi:hypothetical protein